MAVVPALLADRALAEGIVDGARRAAAERSLLAHELPVPEGGWDADAHAGAAEGGFGLLMLAGHMVRRVGREGRYGAELLGAGDLLRPWQHDGEDDLRPFATSWRAVGDVRLAVLGPRFAVRAAPYPEVAAALVGRAMQRSRVLAVHMAIVQQPRVDRRLLLMLRELAERFGTVDDGCGRFSLPLTHELLAELVAARRPSVTSALRDLAGAGLVERDGGAEWIVRRVGGCPMARDHDERG